MIDPVEKPSGKTADAIVLAFLEQVARDRAAGIIRSRNEYQVLFPGFETEIDRELHLLTGGGEEPKAGASIGPYELLDLLGQGGFGTVYRAIDTRVGRPVALKILNLLGAVSADRSRRFQREAKLAARLEHPGICRIYEADFADGIAFIAMELVQGETWAHLIRQKNDRDPRPWARRVRDAARALSYAHDHGVIHRDIKPGNLMEDEQGRVVVLDFGLARDQSDEALTQPWENWGTLPYMSPERLAPDAPLPTPALDIYALGAVLHEGLSGEPPFHGPSGIDLVDRIRRDAPANLSRQVPELSRDLVAIVEHCLEKDPNRRYRTARDLADDLDRYLSGQGVQVRPIGVPRRILRWSVRHPGWAALAAALLVLLPILAASLTYIVARQPDIRAGRNLLLLRQREEVLEKAFFALLQVPATQAENTAGHSRELDAEQLFTTLLEQQDVLEARIGLALTLGRLDRRDEARQAVTRWRQEGRINEAIAAALLEHLESSRHATEAADLAARPVEPLELFVRALGRLLEITPEHQEEARRLYQLLTAAALRLPAPRAFVHAIRAHAAAFAGDAMSTRETAQTLTALWPESAPAAFYAGFALHGGGFPGEAVARFEDALKFEPAFHLAKLALAAARQDSGDLAGARSLFESILKDEPEDATAHINLARLKRQIGRREDAAHHYKQGLKSDPGYHAAWLEHAANSLAIEEIDEAARAYEQAARLLPGQLSQEPRFNYLLAVAFTGSDHDLGRAATFLYPTLRELPAALADARLVGERVEQDAAFPRILARIRARCRHLIQGSHATVLPLSIIEHGGE